MRFFLSFPIHLAIDAFTILFLLLTIEMTTAFQTCRNKPCILENINFDNYSTSLFVSYQQVATTSDAPSSSLMNEKNSQGGLLRNTFNDPAPASITKRDKLKSTRILRTIPSGQKQLPLHIRIVKGIYEESLPWMISLSLPTVISILFQNSFPLFSHLTIEILFFLYCTEKLLRKLNVPVTPEPLVNRDWEDVARLVWSSQDDMESKRDYVMGWFYDAPYDQLRGEDALSYLAWMRYGVPMESGVLSEHEIESLCNFDLPLLLDNINEGKSLPRRQPGEKALPFIRFNCEPLRYRHKSLLFYVVTHGINFLFQRMLEKSGFVHVEAEDAKEDLSYWYRLPGANDEEGVMSSSSSSSRGATPMVFIHGVGGMSFCHKMIHDIKDATQNDNVPIVLIDLPHVSLRMYDEIPNIKSQTRSISRILDLLASKIDRNKCKMNKVTLVGHSYGTAVMSWLVQSQPERIAGCVFLDPICFQLHLKTTLFNFHLQRVDHDIQSKKKWENPFSIGSVINLAGTEMHTNYAMLRKFSWATNALWPEDLLKHKIPSTIILSGNDEIVPVKDVEELFVQRSSEFLDMHKFDGASHGDVFTNDELRAVAVAKVIDMMRIAGHAQNKHESQDSDFESGIVSLVTASC